MPDSTNEIINFLKDQKCLIVEPSATFAASLQSILYEMGVPSGNVIICRKFVDAQKAIETQKPKLLVTEYNVEEKFGLALVEMLEKVHDEMSRISIIVTRNSSDSVVAEAAEEQVDAFLLKPFAPEDFRRKLSVTLHRKLNPSPYMQKIKQGKVLFHSNDLAQAAQEFIGAKPLDEKPTLACFYAGQVFEKQGDRLKALQEFKEGRKYQPLHYKCLVAEFELLMGQKKYPEAYELVELLKDNYPLTPRRLGQIFIAAVFTQHFADLAKFYELFLQIENRAPDLVKITSMAMFSAGKYFLVNNELPQAADLFDKALTITGRDLSMLDRIISEFLKVTAFDRAAEFLSKAPPSSVGTVEHNRLSFKVDAATLPRPRLVERGRKLIMDGQGNPEMFEMVVKLMAQDGKSTLAEAVIQRAVTQYPEMRDGLYRILEENSTTEG